MGEGPLWHPLREELFWFDIEQNQMLSRSVHGCSAFEFDRQVSAAGWLNEQSLLIADEFGLFAFDLENETEKRIAQFENNNAQTRSNDGRADPYGGFWIGTMGKNAEKNAGAIYRYYRGEVRQLFAPITISNSICFSPNGKFAYFTDTPTRKIMCVALDKNNGWPRAEAEVFCDLSEQILNPDGSVVDNEGNLWNAQWGAGRVAKYDQNGEFLDSVELPASQITCPAFGGPQLDQLLITSAKVGLVEVEPKAGTTFVVKAGVIGQKEHQVVL